MKRKWMIIVGMVLLLLQGMTTSVFSEPVKVGIANFGEHPVLTSVIEGTKESMKQNGFKENQEVTYVISHTNFDASLVPQMISKLMADKPKLIISITTPVSQTAKKALQGSSIPLVFSTVTDPVTAKLTPSWDAGDVNVTGVSDLQDMGAVFAFARQLLPNAKKFGFPYNPGEDNDVAILKKAKELAPKHGFTIAEVGVDNPNDVPVRIASLKGKADVIYVSGSNLLQSAAPAVASAARQISLPTLSVNVDHVEKGLFMASFAVDYYKVGLNTGMVAAKILKGTDPKTIAPIRPTYEEHVAKINRKVMRELGVPLPDALKNSNCFVD
ncbi:MAG: ABC transporter substrate-binding protein [Desulfobacterota bacterium]|jgi:putative ABC transport system substrate-binding protein|nr:ABC transporter substrate-binding protein [Thermodesulfobacteriota bacterium]